MQVSSQLDGEVEGETEGGQPPVKKPRLVTPVPEASPSSSSIPGLGLGNVLVPSTPVPARPSTPGQERVNENGNRNGKEGPLQLPTLTELLGLGPGPSKKGASVGTEVKNARESPQPNTNANIPAPSTPTPTPSPFKRSMFSSPLSESPGSALGSGSMGYLVPLRSPATPTGIVGTSGWGMRGNDGMGFTQNPVAFAPAHISSQIPGFFYNSHPRTDPPTPSQARTAQTAGAGNSSGVFAMGYNSQFDIEGEVGRVSELLERDVDFEGWLRDVDENEDGGEGGSSQI